MVVMIWNIRGCPNLFSNDLFLTFFGTHDLGSQVGTVTTVYATEKILFKSSPIFVRHNFDFWPKFRFCPTFNFLKNIDFWCRSRFLTKLSIFDQKFDFSPKFWFFSKISIFHQNFDFWLQFRLLKVDKISRFTVIKYIKCKKMWKELKILSPILVATWLYQVVEQFRVLNTFLKNG